MTVEEMPPPDGGLFIDKLVISARVFGGIDGGMSEPGVEAFD
jgi:hypothetical protein